MVATSGRIYEALCAARHRRPRCDLYHAALVASVEGTCVTVESAPVPDGQGRAERGVVVDGAVGSRWLGRFRVFRYEVRRWPGGVIPDLAYAVASPVRISVDAAAIRQVLDAVAAVPAPVWGRDEHRVGDMWNSNSVVSWTLTRTAMLAAAGEPPPGGRAPGWEAGIRVALAEADTSERSSPARGIVRRWGALRGGDALRGGGAR